jgi:hypothetical protein
VRWYGNTAEADGANCPYAAYKPLVEGDGSAWEQDFNTDAVISQIQRSAWRGAPADMDDESVLAAGLRFAEAYLSQFEHGYSPFTFVYHNVAARKRLADARLRQSVGGARKTQKKRSGARQPEGAGSRGGGGGGGSSRGTIGEGFASERDSNGGSAVEGSSESDVDAAEAEQRPKRKASDGLSHQQRWEQSQTVSKAASGKGKRVRQG